MEGKENYLTHVRRTYAGPWPKALWAILRVIFGGHILVVVFSDVEFLSIPSLLGCTLAAIALVALGGWIKRKYPKC